MSRLLYIKASPRGERSHSVAAADAFVDSWKAANPGGEVVVKELFEAGLPSFDGKKLQAKYNIMHGKDHSADEKAAWGEIEAVIEEFKGFDRYVFAVPMWNFAIPYALKQYIDILVQPGYTFGMNEQGYFGMLEGKKAFAAFASGGLYEDGNPLETYDFQSTYLKAVMGFMGVTDFVHTDVRGMLMDGADSRKSDALTQAAELAKGF